MEIDIDDEFDENNMLIIRKKIRRKRNVMKFNYPIVFILFLWFNSVNTPYMKSRTIPSVVITQPLI